VLGSEPGIGQNLKGPKLFMKEDVPVVPKLFDDEPDELLSQSLVNEISKDAAPTILK
jgi:hypothetical protein